MLYSSANGEAMPKDLDNEMNQDVEGKITFGQKIMAGIDQLSWDLSRASAEEILSVAQAFAPDDYSDAALLEICAFNGARGIRHEVELALAFIRARPERKNCACPKGFA